MPLGKPNSTPRGSRPYGVKEASGFLLQPYRPMDPAYNIGEAAESSQIVIGNSNTLTQKNIATNEDSEDLIKIYSQVMVAIARQMPQTPVR